jgi:hypothetical protein
MRYTLSGDANLDGLVNGLDFNALASNFGLANRIWVQGDFNFDGQVNSMDFDSIAVNFNEALPSPPAEPGSPVVGSVVPEPALTTLLALTPAVLCLRRRYRCR